MNDDTAMRPGRAAIAGRMSRIVGLYQMLLRRNLEHFFPEGILEPAGDRSFIGLEDLPTSRAHYRLADEPDGLGLEIEWFRTRYLFLPGSPRPFRTSERRLVEVGLKVLDRRFRSLFEPQVVEREEMVHYAVEDLTVTEYLDPPDASRVPAVLEALRAAALSTYENRRVSTGLILLGTERDPAAPERVNPPGAPRYNARLAAIRTFHRICDGLRTVYLVDRQGELA
ncbi:MAG: hypothetical protein IRY99_12185, partial [Isosphaeraceae bacterium]|nr:hypothetical protein [Isosphaeraceae bacterium]